VKISIICGEGGGIHGGGRALLLATAASVCGVPTAMAQSVSGVEQAQSITLEEVVVTAQKKSQDLQDVPMSVAAMDSESLIQQNLVTLSDIATRIPGLEYFGSMQSDLAIRGITTGGGTNPTVAVTIDDVPVGSSSYAGQSLTPDLDPAVLNQLEVLRGPQGTLYGANSLGGLIKYVTKEPDTEELSGRIQVDGESVAHGNQGAAGRGSLNLPVLTDRLGLQLSGFYRDDPAYIDDVYPGINKKDFNTNHIYGGRAALLVKVADQLTIDLSYITQHESSVGTGTEYLKQDYSPQTGDLQQSSLVGTYGVDDHISSLRVNYDLDFARLTSVTGYSTLKDDSITDVTAEFGGLIPVLDAAAGFTANPSDRVLINNAHSTAKFSEELRLASQGSTQLEWLGGLFYTWEHSDTVQSPTAIDTAGPLNIAAIAAPSTYAEVAAFADLTYHFTNQFDVQVGDRFADNHQTFSDNTSGPLIILEYGKPTYDLPKGTSSENANTWLITPQYHFTPNLMSYVRVATGYRPGGPNVALPSIPEKTFGSDTVTNYELGLKGTLLDKRLTFDADAFYIDWHRIQLQETDPVSRSEFFANGSRARSTGMEGSVTFKPWEGMTVGANGAYTDAILTANLPTGPTSDIYALKGDSLPFSPRFSGNLAADQDWLLGGGWTGYVGGTLSRVGQRSGVFAENAGLPRLSLPGYTELDLRAGVLVTGWTAQLFVRNAADKRGFVSGSLLNPTSAAAGYEVNPIQPRTIGVVLSKTF
jgi:iron complex outermembrane recepter protein